MPRQPRIVVPGVPHHITQRGNKRAKMFFTREDYLYFLNQLQIYSVKAKLDLVSYCLMPNHTHLIAIPQKPDSLAKALKSVHMKHSQRLNFHGETTGLNWQGRFFSAPMDLGYAFKAIQYVCMNPVRGGLVDKPEDYEWSSAANHLTKTNNIWMTNNSYWLGVCHEALTCLAKETNGEHETDFRLISKHTNKNLPIGREDFILKLEEKVGRKLRLREPGRPEKEIR